MITPHKSGVKVPQGNDKHEHCYHTKRVYHVRGMESDMINLDDWPSTKAALVDRARRALEVLTDDERLDLFFEYCRACGSKDPRCQCWNDE